MQFDLSIGDRCELSAVTILSDNRVEPTLRKDKLKSSSGVERRLIKVREENPPHWPNI